MSACSSCARQRLTAAQKLLDRLRRLLEHFLERSLDLSHAARDASEDVRVAGGDVSQGLGDASVLAKRVAVEFAHMRTARRRKSALPPHSPRSRGGATTHFSTALRNHQ